MTQEDYGKKIDYDPSWTGPLEIARVKTNVRLLIAFGIYLAFWISIAIYAFCTGDIKLLSKSQNIKNFDSSDRQYQNSDFIGTHYLSARNILFGFIVLSIVLSLLYIILLRWYAKFIAYTAICTICSLLLVLIGILSYYQSISKGGSQYWVSIIAAVLSFVIIVIYTIILRKQIHIACGVIKEASKALMFFPSSLLFPILPFLLYIVAISFGGFVFLYLLAIQSSSNDTLVHIIIFHIVNLFGFLWLCSFITAYTQMVLAGTFATWYWSLNKTYVPSNTIIRFMSITTNYHLGTLAFGSLITAICQLINLILSSIRARSGRNCNVLVYCCFSAYTFLFENIERFVRYINCNAYIMSVIHGTGYFTSAKNAFNLLMRNILNAFVVTKITDAILYVGQLFVISFSILVTWKYCVNAERNDIMSEALQLVAVGSGIITVSFFMVLRMAIYTIFLCVLEDFERNDGSEQKPYFMSYKLKALLLK